MNLALGRGFVLQRVEGDRDDLPLAFRFIDLVVRSADESERAASKPLRSPPPLPSKPPFEAPLRPFDPSHPHHHHHHPPALPRTAPHRSFLGGVSWSPGEGLRGRVSGGGGSPERVCGGVCGGGLWGGLGGEGWGPEGWGPEFLGPNISCFFFPSPATIFILSSLSWGSFRGILVVFLKRRFPEMCTFGVLGLSCEAPAGSSGGGPAEGGPAEGEGGPAEGGSTERGASKGGLQRGRFEGGL